MTDASTVASGLAPLHELLRAPLNKDDLEFEVSDKRFLRDFEKAWGIFLRENPNLIPRGIREERIQELQEEAHKVEEETLKVLQELEQQVDFFESSCENLEDLYAGKMQAAIEKQRQTHEELQRRLDDVALADHLQQQTLPWHHFIHEVDQAALLSDQVDDESVVSSRAARPSARAVALTDHSRGCPADIMLRAYRMDHALLSTHIRFLTKEVERYQRTTRTQEVAGRFLREFNAWGILTKNSGGSGSIASGHTSLTGSHF